MKFKQSKNINGKNVYKYLEDRHSMVGVTVRLYDISNIISKELGYRESEVRYIIEFMLRYSSYILGLGYGFRFREFMVHPELKYIDYLRFLEKDILLKFLLEYDMEQVYSNHHGLDKNVLGEIRTQRLLLRRLSIRNFKRIISKKESVQLLKRLSDKKHRGGIKRLKLNK